MPHNETHNPAKDEVEKAGGPLHFPANDELRPTEMMKDTIVGAKNASDKEHKMTLIQGLKLYPKAVGWSMLISTCIVMEGFDVALINNLYSFPQFQKKFGVRQPNGSYQLTAPWQSGLSNGANCGEIIGLFINGFVSERFGYRLRKCGCICQIAMRTC